MSRPKTMDTIDWLLDSDPAIRWQAMHDLTDASPAAVAAERARVPREGVGAEILARQGSDGSWHRAGAPVWLPTLYTLLRLRATGVARRLACNLQALREGRSNKANQ